jgi:predicted O-linked N-acetylglucosamine transferase (SPINDLY family)
LDEVEKLISRGQWQEAVALYRISIINASFEIKPILNYNLGVLLSQNGLPEEAEEAYRSAIFLKPDFVQAWFNLGSTVENLGKKEKAILIWQSMLDHPLVGKDIDTEMYTMVLNAQGRIHEEIREFEKAEAYLFESLQTNSQQPNVVQHWVHLRQKQCKWPIYTEIKGVDIGDMLKGTSPLSMLSISDDPGLQLAAAIRFVYNKLDFSIKPLNKKNDFYNHKRLKIGFLSSDFCLHAVSLLTVELIELIDRTQFEVIGFCWSKEDGSDLRKRILNAFDKYVPIHHLSDEEAAHQIANEEIDVLVDLHGITSGARPNILFYRPAPVQITYLGFPGTTGHPCIDFVIADRYLIPSDYKPFYTEEPIYMPNTFQCSDSKRQLGSFPTKLDYGLPDNKFIFCSFNNNFKITPEIFQAWMDILKGTPDSILWLLEDNQWAKKSMLQEAENRGVDINRLYFTGRVTPANYLARYQLANLFLDCFPFNGGTTVNDALWVKLPVLTLSGRSFASRMAGSLLKGLNQTHMICDSIESYIKTAIDFSKKSTPKPILSLDYHNLFDQQAFAKDFEINIKNISRHHS